MSRLRPRVAALDIGTNSFHMILAELDPVRGAFRVLHREKEVVRLGSSAGDMSFLSEEAMERAVAAIRRFKALANSAGAPLKAIATSAVREAYNRDEFVRRVERQAGVKVRVASGAEEARLTYHGAVQAVPPHGKVVLLVDVGGGSTELLIGQRRRVRYANSLKLGAVRLTDRFFRGGKVDSSAVRKCAEYVEGTLSSALRELRHQEFEKVLGTSGTILSLAKMIRVAEEEDVGPLSGFTFRRSQLEKVVQRLLAVRSSSERARLPGLDPARADIIVAGALVVRAVFQGARLDEMTVSTSALREGMLADELRRLAPGRGPALSADRLEGVLEAARNFRCDEVHARQVARLALKIFDGTRRLHRMNGSEREYLEAAALLHEAGLFVSHAGHHRHSYYLVRNSDLLGFSENEKEIIANVARYHRKGPPRPRHEGFDRLSPEDQQTVTRLSAILRVADGLDRSHSSAVSELGCKLGRSKVRIKLKRRAGRRLNLELWGAAQKADLFEEVFRRKLELAAPRGSERA